MEVELELGAVPCSCWGVNQIAFANAKQGRFVRKFPWILAGLEHWGSTEQTWVPLVWLDQCLQLFFSESLSSKKEHKARAMARLTPRVTLMSHGDFPFGSSQGLSQTADEQDPTQGHHSQCRT